MTALLNIDTLDVDIHATPILRQVSLSLAPGEIYGLVGESGSGKSMTALAIMQLLPKGAGMSGTIDLAGQRLDQLAEKQLCGLRGQAMGMIFQEPMTALNPLQTIGDQVAETLRLHQGLGRTAALQRARAQLDRVGLQAQALSRFPHQLSGGQRQRVCIAMAIALRPALLIADEPTTALDVTTQAQILALLKQLVTEDGMALLLITHDLAVVSDMAQRIGVMKSGEILETGLTHQVLQAPQHAYTRALLAASQHKPQRRVQPQRQTLIEATDLRRVYPKRHAWFGKSKDQQAFVAVDQVSFQLYQGECLGLVGESGCGKSSLARVLLGLDQRQGGELVIDGQSLALGQIMPRALRQAMGVVFQDPAGSFNPRLTVGRILAEPFYLADRPPQDLHAHIRSALEAVGLEARDVNKYPHEFSGGQRQRIAIARALMLRPKVIVLDEAVSALDVSVRAKILDLLADLQAAFGLSYLFITHDISVVEAMCDRVLVMRQGQILEHGPTHQVLGAPSHPYTQQLMAAVPRLMTA